MGTKRTELNACLEECLIALATKRLRSLCEVAVASAEDAETEVSCGSRIPGAEREYSLLSPSGIAARSNHVTAGHDDPTSGAEVTSALRSDTAATADLHDDESNFSFSGTTTSGSDDSCSFSCRLATVSDATVWHSDASSRPLAARQPLQLDAGAAAGSLVFSFCVVAASQPSSSDAVLGSIFHTPRRSRGGAELERAGCGDAVGMESPGILVFPQHVAL